MNKLNFLFFFHFSLAHVIIKPISALTLIPIMLNEFMCDRKWGEGLCLYVSYITTMNANRHAKLPLLLYSNVKNAQKLTVNNPTLTCRTYSSQEGGCVLWAPSFLWCQEPGLNVSLLGCTWTVWSHVAPHCVPACSVLPQNRLSPLL